ncbi:hypothetical protein BJY01DRAFT_110907 [Aspergillus pseudoustus]|uniref:Uncharacterized protein n=1 Tax=Aspergillus pseudoustus TaxID=1810923 RepID=A0ABR4IT40_9EURO
MMDPASRIRYALEILSDITDDELKEHKSALAPIFTRFSTIISHRTETRASILDTAVARLSETDQFLKEKDDLTNLVLERLITADDPRTAFLSNSTDWLLFLLRALSTRYLVRGYEMRYGTGQGQANNSRRSGKIKVFLEEEGLSGSPVTNAIKTGRKLYKAEENLEIPGVWIIFIPALPKLAHLCADEVGHMINFLSDGRYPELIDAARRLSKLWVECSRLYTIYIPGKGRGSVECKYENSVST